LDEDIYNFNETGFHRGIISTAKIITGADRGSRPVLKQQGNRDEFQQLIAHQRAEIFLPYMGKLE
jgi:hypothetical protein